MSRRTCFASAGPRSRGRGLSAGLPEPFDAPALITPGIASRPNRTALCPRCSPQGSSPLHFSPSAPSPHRRARLNFKTTSAFGSLTTIARGAAFTISRLPRKPTRRSSPALPYTRRHTRRRCSTVPASASALMAPALALPSPERARPTLARGAAYAALLTLKCSAAFASIAAMAICANAREQIVGARGAAILKLSGSTGPA
jgi:hypothetical protein